MFYLIRAFSWEKKPPPLPTSPKHQKEQKSHPAPKANLWNELYNVSYNIHDFFDREGARGVTVIGRLSLVFFVWVVSCSELPYSICLKITSLRPLWGQIKWIICISLKPCKNCWIKTMFDADFSFFAAWMNLKGSNIGFNL